MSDQQAPSHEDTPAVAGPAGDTGAQEQADVDWQKRYTDVQAEYTRSQQRNKEFEDQHRWYDLALTSEDEDTRRQAIEALGYELPDDDEQYEQYENVEELDPAEYDPVSELHERQAALEQHIIEQDQEAQQESEAALIRAITDERLGQLEGLSEDDQDMVLAYALTHLDPVQEPGVPVPLPDIQQAYDAFVARETERQKQWAKTKRAPFVASGGQEATQVPDTSTHDGRVQAMLRNMQDAEAAS
jgi:hypothetical protein